MTSAEQAIIDAAIEVSVFSKTQPYPSGGTPKFFAFAQKLDALATAINAAYPNFNHNVAAYVSRAPGWKVVPT